MKKKEKSVMFLAKTGTCLLTLLLAMLSEVVVYASVETGWPVGKTNNCKNSTDIFINFEGGVDRTEVLVSNPNLEFTNTEGLNWQYLDFTTGNYNTSYIMNGNGTTWLGESGNTGRITFSGGGASYLSLLVKTYSGLEIDAYDAEGNHLANSGRAGENLSSGTMTRLTVEAENIAYVEVHDSGNYWTVDDICTDAAPVCKPVPGFNNGEKNERIDLVFVMDEDYKNDLKAFLADVVNKINNRLGKVSPTDENLNKFNFYYTDREGHVDSNTCGQTSTLPDNLLNNCSFADAIVVLHTEEFGDCKRNNGAVSIFSAEGNSNRSFIHEAGHALFELKDEYDSNRETGRCDYTNYRGAQTPSNIWATEEDCKKGAEGQTWSAAQCYMFTPCQDDWWKLGDSSLEGNDAKYNDNNFSFIMKDGVFFDRGFGSAASKRINWVFDQLLLSSTSTSNSGESFEKSFILDLNISESGVYLENTSYILSQSPNYYQENRDLTAKIFINNGSLIGSYSFNDPRYVDAEYDYSGPGILDQSTFKLILPLSSSIERAEIIEEKTGNIVATANLEKYSTKQAQEGDLNDDGIVDRFDVNIINKYLNQPSFNNPGCDVDNDGIITIYDARKLVRMCTYPRCLSN